MLVIDDDPTVRDLMQRFLSKEGFCVVAAASGEEGLRLAKDLAPDRHHPGRDDAGHGRLGGADGAKADPELADIPVIMLTIVDDKNMGFALGRPTT